jgi:hypothetical protein
MNGHKQRKEIDTTVLRDGARVVKVRVPVTVDYFLIHGKWEKAISAVEMEKIERAIELAWPGWFHRFTKEGKHRKDCQACKRKKVA